MSDETVVATKKSVFSEPPLYPHETVSLQDLEVGDRIKLVEEQPCTVLAIHQVYGSPLRRVLTVSVPKSLVVSEERVVSVWLWKFSRIEKAS